MPYGPNGFDGLPGLIVKLEKENYILLLDRIVFHEEEIIVDKPKGKIVNDDELIDILSKAMGISRKEFLSIISRKM